MIKIRCLIVEDEKPAQEVIASHIARVDSLELVAVLGDAVAALDFLRANDIDLIFLDIQIPSLSGIDFLKVLKNPPQVIITSAYSKYAIDAFDLDVRDYLMKPISFERFMRAIHRVTPAPDLKKVYQLATLPGDTEKSFAFFNVNKTMVRVDFAGIVYIESMREYVYIHTDTQKVITKMGIGEMEKMLPPHFLRIHRSYLVNQEKITAFNAEEIFVGKISLPIGTNYKKLLESVLNKYTLLR